jgi:alkylated DNA repair dioxygenase AlkB
LPSGFLYAPELITAAAQETLVSDIVALPFAPFQFHGFTGNRRVVSFGWRYSFDGGGLQKADDMPEFLSALRPAIGRFSGIEPSSFEHVMVTEYAPGAAIGWHKDRSVFPARSAFDGKQVQGGSADH